MAINFKTNNPNNWQLIDSRSLIAEPGPVPNRTVPIPPYSPSIQLSGTAILVDCRTDTYKSTWFTGGWLYRLISANIQNSPVVPRTYAENANKFYLNKETFISFDEYFDSYLLYISVPSWLKTVDIDIYEYVGERVDTVEQKVEAIKLQLDTIERKIDDCCNGGTPQQSTIQQQQLGFNLGFL